MRHLRLCALVLLLSLTQNVLVDPVGDVKALSVCEVFQQEAVDPKTLLAVLSSFQGEPFLFSAKPTTTKMVD